MFTTQEKVLLNGALAREIASMERFIKQASPSLKDAAEKDLMAVAALRDKIRAVKSV